MKANRNIKVLAGCPNEIVSRVVDVGYAFQLHRHGREYNASVADTDGAFDLGDNMGKASLQFSVILVVKTA